MTRHILCVDDEHFIRRLIEVNLVRAGYRVTTACDGVDALEKLHAYRPDLVVLDWMMPRMDGHALLRALKMDQSTCEIPVLMLTAKAQDADIFEGWRSGCDSYLTKPFNPMELTTWVKRVLGADAALEAGSGRIRIG